MERKSGDFEEEHQSRYERDGILARKINDNDEEVLQMRWCLVCGKMVTNEFVRCPGCGYIFPKAEEDKTFTDEGVEDIEKETEILTLIKELKVTSASHLKMKEYNEAIIKAEEIIKLARAFEMQSIVKEQEEFIDNVLSLRDQKDGITKIIDELKELQQTYEGFLDQNRIVEAHSLLSRFLEKYRENIDFSSILLLKNFMLKDAELWRDFNETQDNLERQLEQLEVDYNAAAIAGDLEKADGIINLAKVLLIEMINNDYHKRWDQIEKELREVRGDYNKNVEFLMDLELIYKDNLQKKQFDTAINDVKRIIESAENIGEFEIAEKYKDIQIKIKEKLIEFKDRIKRMSNEGSEALQNVEVLKALKKYKEIKSNLINFEIKTEEI